MSERRALQMLPEAVRDSLIYNMKLQKRGSRFAGPDQHFTFARPLGDAQQQADHQGPPQQPAKSFGQIGGPATEKSGCQSLSHHLPQGGATRLTTDGVERLRDLRRIDRFGDGETKHSNHRWITDLTDELGPENSQDVCESLPIVQRG